MPRYKTHLLGGAIFFVPLYYITTTFYKSLSPAYTALLLGVTLFGALFPDLDITSKIQRLFYLCIIIIFLGFLLAHQWSQLLITSIIAIVIGMLRHRTILHNPIFLALLPLPIIYYISNNNSSLYSTLLPSLFFIAGTWSHLLLDFGFKTKK